MAADAQSRSNARVAVHAEESGIDSKHVYRACSVLGLVVIAVCTLAIASTVELALPIAGGPGTGQAASPAGSAGSPAALAATAVVIVLATLPLCKPRQRRILDTVTESVRSVAIAGVIVATVGYFSYRYRLPRSTLLLTVGVLFVALPTWFVALQQWQLKRSEGTLVVGNNPRRIEAAVQAAAEPIVGYAFSPTDSRAVDGDARTDDDVRTGDPGVHAATDGVRTTGDGRRVGTDGGRPAIPDRLAQYECLGGLSRLDAILEQSDVGTVIPALPQTDRAEFFGVLETCHRHDVNVEILSEHNRSVLIEDEGAASSERTRRLIGINMEPLDLQNRVVKRCFDLAFAGIGLLLTLLLLLPIGLAIKLDSRGPVLYRQERTTQFGDRFPVYKFRSMVPEGESAEPGEEATRVTRVGRVLRRTHLDELPQLWAIFTGQMSVVGPRAAWTAEEEHLQREMDTWKKRWFVKPGLTGLAQINEATSETSRAKLQYDLTYIRNQSFRFDCKIVVRQVWMVVTDGAGVLGDRLAGRLDRIRR